jgi:hypothetical protein
MGTSIEVPPKIPVKHALKRVILKALSYLKISHH